MASEANRIPCLPLMGKERGRSLHQPLTHLSISYVRPSFEGLDPPELEARRLWSSSDGDVASEASILDSIRPQIPNMIEFNGHVDIFYTNYKI